MLSDQKYYFHLDIFIFLKKTIVLLCQNLILSSLGPNGPNNSPRDGPIPGEYPRLMMPAT